MRTFIINLARRPDRKQYIHDQLVNTALHYEYIDAVDAQSPDFDALRRDNQLTAQGPWGTMSHGTLACTLSHFKVLQRIAEGEDRFAAVLEDDVAISPSFAEFVKDEDWIPEHAQIVRLEHWNDPKQVIVMDRDALTVGRFALKRLRSRTAGSAGYIISRQFANHVLRHKHWFTMPIDHVLFNIGQSKLTRDACVYQLLPSVVIQDARWGTNISAAPPAKSVFNQLRRGGYEIASAARPLLRVLRQQASISKTYFDPEFNSRDSGPTP